MTPTVVTPGNYDGVHLGHRALLTAANERAGDSMRMVAMFFDPHPTRFFRPDKAQPLLTRPDRRRALLKDAGADDVIVQAFDHDFSQLEPRAFIAQVLHEDLHARAIVVGEDFRFGRGRTGNVDRMRELGRELDIDVITVPAVQSDEEVVSSTRIRNLLRAGDVQAAATLLSRVHDVKGRVVQGHQRGRTIGFPTANLDCEDILLPKDGVYAVVANVDGKHVAGVANLGVRPTFQAGRSVEVHLFDFDQDIYGADIRVGFTARVRDEQRFGGLEELKAQIAKDAQTAQAQNAEVDPELLRLL